MDQLINMQGALGSQSPAKYVESTIIRVFLYNGSKNTLIRGGQATRELFQFQPNICAGLEG
jgi:hypothetical protein